MSSKALAQTQDKALQLNLASTIYGTFAEIGAGQETANWFFRASGAAGTVAKTISAYDMTVSDTLYGPVKRYVSEERLKGMLDYEFTQLVNRLGPQRGKDTRFFAFCNTVKVKGYRDNGPWHGWIGVRGQIGLSTRMPRGISTIPSSDALRRVSAARHQFPAADKR